MAPSVSRILGKLMSFEIFISRRYFGSKPKQAIIALITLFSVIGVAIGVTALIVVIAVMGGFETDLKTRIMSIEPHLIIKQHEGPLADFARVVRLAQKTPGVRSAWPVVELQVMLKSESRVAGATIKGVDPKALARGMHLGGIKALEQHPDLHKQASRASEAPALILGRDLARSLGVIKGDSLFVVSPRGILAPVGFVPYMKRFEVADFFETGMYEYDGSLAFMNLSDAQILDHLRPALASAVEVRINDIFQAPAIGRAIISQLGPGYTFQDWGQLNRNLFSALKLEKTAMFITLTLIILVATFSITSSLVMMVMEKTKDIAIFKTLGATGRVIEKIFVLQGMLIGVIGTTAGVLLGTALCFLQEKYKLVRLPGDVYYITALPVDLKISDVVMVAAAALFICFLATLYPARQASRLDPVEAIRYG
jgi:lipoprotein-releasing system permease protein